MKVGIITFNSAHNYGAVLQAWALQEYLGTNGHEVEIINYRLPAIDNVYRLFEPEKPYHDEKKNQKHQNETDTNQFVEDFRSLHFNIIPTIQ